MLERIFEAPEEYQDLALQSLLVPRFTRSYKEGIFRVSTGAHLISGVDRINRLQITAAIKDKIERGFWIHDLPEVSTSDFTIIQKENNPDLLKRLEQEESDFVKKWFSKDDQKLYWEIEQAENFFNYKTNVAPPIEALIVKLEDTIEGDLFYHKELSLWCKSTDYDRGYVPSDVSLTYSFRTNEQRTKRLMENPDAFSPYINIFKNELIDELITIKNYWKSVPQDRIPNILKNQLLHLKTQLMKLHKI